MYGPNAVVARHTPAAMKAEDGSEAGEQPVVAHRRYDAIKFDVHGVDRTFGIANLQARIEVRALPRKEDR